MIIVGVDPGETAGVCRIEAWQHAYDNELRTFANSTMWQLNRRRTRKLLESHVDLPPGSTIAAERYTITARTARLTRQPAALEFIGVLREICEDRELNFVLQPKSDAAKLGNDTVLKQLGWYIPGWDHANDGARQALLALSGVEPSLFRALMLRDRIEVAPDE